MTSMIPVELKQDLPFSERDGSLRIEYAPLQPPKATNANQSKCEPNVVHRQLSPTPNCWLKMELRPMEIASNLKRRQNQDRTTSETALYSLSFPTISLYQIFSRRDFDVAYTMHLQTLGHKAQTNIAPIDLLLIERNYFCD